MWRLSGTGDLWENQGTVLSLSGWDDDETCPDGGDGGRLGGVSVWGGRRQPMGGERQRGHGGQDHAGHPQEAATGPGGASPCRGQRLLRANWCCFSIDCFASVGYYAVLWRRKCSDIAPTLYPLYKKCVCSLYIQQRMLFEYLVVLEPIICQWPDICASWYDSKLEIVKIWIKQFGLGWMNHPSYKYTAQWSPPR